MFPLRDDNPTRNVPFLTVSLIILNVLAFLYEFIQPDQGMRVVMQFGFIPAELTRGVELSPQAYFPTIGTMFTSMFLHGGWMHLIGNMLYLWIFGNNVEDLLGPIWFIPFYLLCGVGAVSLFVLTAPNSEVPMIGASGAISGVLGLYALKWPRARVMTAVTLGFFIRMIWIPALAVLGIWFLMQLLFAFLSTGSEASGGVAYMAHVGGFLVGLVAAVIVRKPESSWDSRRS
jgi:membrane associated rhomboid family serine protease